MLLIPPSIPVAKLTTISTPLDAISAILSSIACNIPSTIFRPSPANFGIDLTKPLDRPNTILTPKSINLGTSLPSPTTKSPTNLRTDGNNAIISLIIDCPAARNLGDNSITATSICAAALITICIIFGIPARSPSSNVWKFFIATDMSILDNVSIAAAIPLAAIPTRAAAAPISTRAAPKASKPIAAPLARYPAPINIPNPAAIANKPTPRAFKGIALSDLIETVNISIACAIINIAGAAIASPITPTIAPLSPRAANTNSANAPPNPFKPSSMFCIGNAPIIFIA